MKLDGGTANTSTESQGLVNRLALAGFGLSGILVLFDRYTDNYLRPLLWVILALLVTVTIRKWRQPAGPGFSSRFTRSEAKLLGVLFGWLIVTVILSANPRMSLVDFATEGGIFIPFALMWLFWSPRREDLQIEFKKLGAGILVLGVLAGFIAAMVYITGSSTTREWMETSKHHGSTFVRREDPTITHSVWRLNFPFGHHNRMAYFSMVASLVALWMCFLRKSSLLARVGWLCCAAMSLANLGMTLNRGAWGALVVGLAVMGALRLGRSALWMLLLPPLVFAALPEAQKERIVRLTLPSTYTNARSTINLRFSHWAVALEMTKTKPVFGVGYGFNNFENYYPRIAKEKFGQQDFEAVHAHNVWLETSAESGIPAAVLFFAWSLVRWAMLVRLWKRRASLFPGDVAMLILWIGLECAIQSYCLVNLPLRRSLGLLTWVIWMLMTADITRMANEGRRNTKDTDNLAAPVEG